MQNCASITESSNLEDENKVLITPQGVILFCITAVTKPFCVPTQFSALDLGNSKYLYIIISMISE
jgi:hypothetical protein